MAHETILIVDDKESERYLLEVHLQGWGYATIGAGDGAAALAALRSRDVDLVLSDLVMPGLDGMGLLAAARDLTGDIPFIMLTAHSSIATAVSAIKLGAHNYIAKPVDREELRTAVEQGLAFRRLRCENRKLRDRLRELYSFQNIVTRAASMSLALRLAERVAAVPDTTVALFGESGVGKEVLARAIHFAGDRMENPFVAVNCAGIPAALLESELFGHVRGAFTGADRERKGKFDAARGGTILLDEVGDMPPEIQAKLLRVLQERMYERLGSNEQIKADFRVIAATHRDLAALVAEGRFREDLYHRLTAFPITIPPLRERVEDIPLLAEHFMGQLKEQLGKHLPGISAEGMEELLRHRWPGNIRELRNRLERAAILTDGELITPAHLNLALRHDAAAPAASDGQIRIDVVLPAAEFSLDAAVALIIADALKRCGNNKVKAARFLKVSRNRFYKY